MARVNEVHISGRAVRDAVRNGKGPFRFSIAHGGGKKRDTEDRYPTEFFDVVCWHDSAGEVKRGVEVVITGRLHQSTWEADGQKRSRVEVVATELTLPAAPLTPASMTGGPTPPKGDIGDKFNEIRSPQDCADRRQTVCASRPITAQDPITDEDIPF